MDKKQLINITQSRFDELSILLNTNLKQEFIIKDLKMKLEVAEERIQELQAKLFKVTLK